MQSTGKPSQRLVWFLRKTLGFHVAYAFSTRYDKRRKIWLIPRLGHYSCGTAREFHPTSSEVVFHPACKTKTLASSFLHPCYSNKLALQMALMHKFGDLGAGDEGVASGIARDELSKVLFKHLFFGLDARCLVEPGFDFW